jgi:hypothetical protein
MALSLIDPDDLMLCVEDGSVARHVAVEQDVATLLLFVLHRPKEEPLSEFQRALGWPLSRVAMAAVLGERAGLLCACGVCNHLVVTSRGKRAEYLARTFLQDHPRACEECGFPLLPLAEHCPDCGPHKVGLEPLPPKRHDLGATR